MFHIYLFFCLFFVIFPAWLHAPFKKAENFSILFTDKFSGPRTLSSLHRWSITTCWLNEYMKTSHILCGSHMNLSALLKWLHLLYMWFFSAWNNFSLIPSQFLIVFQDSAYVSLPLRNQCSLIPSGRNRCHFSSFLEYSMHTSIVLLITPC